MLTCLCTVARRSRPAAWFPWHRKRASPAAPSVARNVCKPSEARNNEPEEPFECWKIAHSPFGLVMHRADAPATATTTSMYAGLWLKLDNAPPLSKARFLPTIPQETAIPATKPGSRTANADVNLPSLITALLQ